MATAPNSANAFPNKRARYGRTALHRAAVDNDPDEIKHLLSLGSFHVDVLDENDQTPLHLAASRNRGDSHYDSIELLLSKGAEVNARNGQDNTPLSFLISRAGFKIVQLLLSYNANVNLKNDSGRIPLNCAVLGGKVDVVQLLIDHGSDVNSVDKYGSTPLISASYDGKLEIIKCLLRNGADINAVNSTGRTPFMVQLSNSKESANKLAYLLKYSDVNVMDFEGKNVLSCRQGKIAWKIIVEHIAKLEALNISIHLDLISKISSSNEYSDYFKKCKDELAVTKSVKLHNSWVTFFDLLVGSTKKLKNYAGNQDLVRDFKKSDCKNKFTVYGVTIWKNANKGIKIRRMFDKSIVLLSDCLPVFNPTHLVMRDILDCLKYKDYVKFAGR